MKKILCLALLGCLSSIQALAQTPPDFSMAFSPDASQPGDIVTLVYTLDNSANGSAAQTVEFTDLLPNELVFAEPINTSSSCPSGAISVSGGSISYSSGEIPADGTCRVLIDIVAPSVEGAYANTSQDLTSSFGNSGSASATLNVADSVFFLPLPVDEDFESVAIQSYESSDYLFDIPGFRYELENAGGRFAIQSDFDPDGVRIASMDNPGGGGVNRIILGFDGTSIPSGQELYLDFNWFDHGDEGDPQDVVELRASPADDWIQIYDFQDNSNNGSWTNVTNLELIAFLNANSQALTEYAQIRFSQTDNFPINTDGISIDDVEVGPSVKFDKGFSPAIVAVGDTATLTFTINNRGALAASGIDFTDNLPTGTTLASPVNATTDCNGNLTATDGAATIVYTGGSLAAGTSCTIDVDVTTSAPGDLVNTSNNLTSSAGDSGSAQAALTVTTEPGFSKAFDPTTAPVATTSTLTFTLDNAANTVEATGVDFTDNLPAGVVIADTPNLATTCTGGSLTAAAGTGTISYSGGTLEAGSTCTIDVDVTSQSPGSYDNVTEDLTTSLGNSGSASANIVFTAEAPLFSKAFSVGSVGVGLPVTLTFTLDNSANGTDATAATFTDNLPTGLVVAPSPNAINSCTGGTLTAAAGSGSISYTGGTVPAASACTMAVDVVANVAGTFNNVTDDLTSNLGNSGSASASLSANEAPGFGTGFSPTTIVPGQTAAMSFTVDNSGASEAANGLSFSLTLPSGLQVASPANIATSCGGTLAVNGDTLDYSGGSVAAGASCTVSIDVVAFVGTFAPTTTLSSNLGSAPGAMLTGALTVNVIAVPTLSSISLVLLMLMILLAGLGFGTRRLG